MTHTTPQLTGSRFPRLLRTQGIARPVAWGFAALTLFMVGDGIESGFLSPYLSQLHFSEASVALLWSVYGIVVAVASWLSSALAEAWGPRRMMLLGSVIWCVFEVVFLVLGVMRQDFAVMLVAFGIRGLGYPMFAYGFLVWVTLETPEEVMGRAVGWYWFFSTLGLGVISSYYVGAVIDTIGPLATLWTSLVFTTAGGLMVAFLLKNPVREPVTLGRSIRGVAGAVTIVGSRPKVGVGGVVRLINTLSFYAFVVFLSTYMVHQVGFTQPQWQVVWGTMLAANVLANLVSGYLGDWIGRVDVVAWFGGIGCFFTVLGLFYLPTVFGPAFALTLVVGVLYGFTLGMFVPLSAIVPLLAPRHRASAVAILNLGAGLSQFAGPVVAGLVTPIGVEATVWVIAVLYLVGFALTFLLRQNTTERAEARAAVPFPQ
ncbi:MFS transporter [Streptomyces sp. WAC06614]|uniref:MFS transporter n=1 Tax=Streptomyces sp. WAC06614 TaxID=2487416 RepID=UPI000F792217|nr:MFS transporter [Streptomyces sp. WAC06614]RSS76713.1 MFS transporter [Streptomyces sp. WAC06614]